MRRPSGARSRSVRARRNRRRAGSSATEKRSSNWSMTSRTCASVGVRHVSGGRGSRSGPDPMVVSPRPRRVRVPPSAASTWSSGSAPGTIAAITHRSEPGAAPARRRGIRPAATTLDLPEPDGPTSAISRCPARDGVEEPTDQRLPTEEVSGILLAERPEALVRVVCGRPPRCAGRRCEGRVVEQDPLLEPLQRRRWIEAQLVGEELPESLVRPKGLRMPSRAVQREHEDLAGPLAKGVLPDGCLDQRQRIWDRPRLEQRGSQLLDRVEVSVVEASDVRLGEFLVGEVGQCRATPEREG